MNNNLLSTAARLNTLKFESLNFISADTSLNSHFFWLFKVRAFLYFQHPVRNFLAFN